MGYRHSRAELLAAAEEVALASGIASVTFASVAQRAGTNDRTVVYYFPSKADLIGAVVVSLGHRLQALLDRAFGPDPLPARDLGRRAWPVLARPDADPVFAVFFQVLGLATAGTEPFALMARGFTESWIDWVAPRIQAPDPRAARHAAAAMVAQLDGLLLLRSVAGPRTANAAARELGLLD